MLVTTRAAFAPAGSAARRVPEILALMQPSDPRRRTGLGSGPPLPSASSVARAAETPAGLPGYGLVLSLLAVLQDSADSSRGSPCVPLSVLPAAHPTASAIGTRSFRSYCTARSLGCLRFAVRVAAGGARLPSGPPGAALSGRVSHPQDDLRSSRGGMASSFPLRPTGPGRTGCSPRGAPVRPARSDGRENAKRSIRGEG